MKVFLLCSVFLSFFAQSSFALLLFGFDNYTNTTAPEGVDLPWDSAARVANFNGVSASSPAGSAVHLGWGYMLTANHVANRSHVSFDGITWYARDTSFTPVQVAAGVDLKIFRLTETPQVSAVVLHSGGGENNNLGYHIGWGRGRANDDHIGENVQAFGDDSTIAKRWGTNVVKAVQQTSWTVSSTSYTQQTLVNVLGNSEGSNEAALATYDSGSPFFQVINNTIVLSGIGGAITQQTAGSATFGADRLTGANQGDRNYLIQIGPYSDAIMAIIPEPSAFVFIFGFVGFFIVLSARKRSLCPLGLLHHRGAISNRE
jgi:hypothetical protein